MDVLRRRWFPWAAYGTAVISLAPFAVVAYALAPQESDVGVNCGGIGFGEVPCGWDSVALLYVLIGVPYVFGSALIIGLTELLGARVAALRSILALVLLAIPWVVAALVALA